MDEQFMRRAIAIAQFGAGKTYPNPLVGAVIVHENKIIGEGFHQYYGGHHAEVNAVASVGDKSLLKNSTIYVTLEPCSHFGKTPPCAHLMIEHQIKRVVIACKDPHTIVNGKGIALLQSEGIDVLEGVCEQEAFLMNQHFMIAHQKQRPYILLKWAESKNGFMDIDRSKTVYEGSYPLSTSLSQLQSHTLRSRFQAIMVGKNTVLVDNPTLTTRKCYGKNPVRVVVDKDLKIPVSFKIFDTQSSTIIFNNHKEMDEGHHFYKRIDFSIPIFPQIFQLLYKEYNIISVIVEGGQSVLQQCLDMGLYDEIVIFQSKDKILKDGGLKSPSKDRF